MYEWASTLAPADVLREADAAGWRSVHLDTRDTAGKAAFLDAAATAFGFPGWFGRNWDALADSLGDVRADPGTLVLWEGWADFLAADEQQFEIALELLRERAESDLGGAFAVLLYESETEAGGELLDLDWTDEADA